MKKVLVIHYSQSGQLTEIVNTICKPFGQAGVSVTNYKIEMEDEYPFPWTKPQFFDVFPESFLQKPQKIKPIPVDIIDNEYDLIILGCQVWYLSPSIPINSFLSHPSAKVILNNKPVVTVIGCRNMWIMAQEKVKVLLSDIDAKLIDNIVLIDQGSSLSTFITTPRWMLTGRKNPFWKIFPRAGISDKDIKNSSRFGFAIKEALENDLEKENKSICSGLEAVNVNEKLIKSEQIGTKSFMIWGKLIRKIGKPGDSKRKPFIALYTVFLILMIIIVVPINMIVQTIIRKINKDKILKQKALYEMPSGSEDYRMKDFNKYE